MTLMDPNDQMVDYIRTVCSRIKCREIHSDIRLELQSHFDELTEEFSQTGISQEEAVNRAIRQMGDPTLLGDQLNRVHSPRIEWSLLVAVAAFISIGLLTMYSLGSMQTVPGFHSVHFLKDKLVAIAISAPLALLLFFSDYRKLKRFAPHLFSLTLLLMFIVLLNGRQVMGTLQLNLGFTTVSVYDISPIFLLIGLCGVFADWDWSKKRSLPKLFALLLIPCFLYLKNPSFHSIVIYVAGVAMLVARTRPARSKLLALAAIGAAFPAVICWYAAQHYYVLRRLTLFLKQQNDPNGYGYQELQSMQAIHSAGWWGHGIGASLVTVPELPTDLPFTYLVYMLGWGFGIGLCVLAVYFVIRFIQIAGQIKEPFGASLLRVIALMFGINFMWNIMGAVGFAPVGAGLPFISYGGSQLLMEIIVVGIALSVYRRKDMMATGLAS